VKFGIFYEHQLPRPWADGDEHRLIQDALEQIELADRLGFDVAWEVEHHFLEEYSHSSAPEVFLAAASQRTSRIRLGHGIVQTPPPFNHPARVAERIAMLDLVSGGRVEFGSGEAASAVELEGFGIDPDRKRDMWREGLEVALRCLTEEPFTGHEGEFVSMPPRNVVPKPLQKPHPPLWIACSRRETILLAAEHGLGVLTFAFVDPEEAKAWVDEYHTTLAEKGVAIGESVNPNLAAVTTMMCAPTEEEAIARGVEGANFFGYSLGHYYGYGDHRPGDTDVWAEFVARRAERGYSPEAASGRGAALQAKPSGEQGSGLRGAIGTPEQVREFVRRYEEAGVDQLIFVLQAGNNRHEDICASLELFGAEVLPEFAEREAAEAPGRERRRAEVAERVLARRDRQRPSMDGFTVPAYPLRQLRDDEEGRAFLDRLADEQATGTHRRERTAPPA
jgi:alkanesulfonate monooxygenase SsuD/methylene tetrahydromethanopterin reductase-like flavin-dependent oxidoreductase (luciferase family)